VENGLCARDADINVQVRGGTLTVRYAQDGLILHGNTEQVYEGTLEI